MKKYIYLILSLLLIPIMVNAETLTYNVCESGCEYTNLDDVSTAIRNIGDLSDKDIVINVNSDMNNNLGIGNFDNIPNSVTINGNNHIIGSDFEIFTKKLEINRCNIVYSLELFLTEKIVINNTVMKYLAYYSIDSNIQIKPEEINLSELLDIDEKSLNNIISFNLIGNIKIENMDFSNQVLMLMGGKINIYSSEIGKIINHSVLGNIKANINNSKFNTLKYKNITSNEELNNELVDYDRTGDTSTLNYDIYDINIESSNMTSNTTIYFDKEAKLKPGDKLNLAEFLDYYTEDKEIEYTIEDESIAKIENKELIALKEGSTKVTVTTDEGHVVYRINLVVEKETIPEKIDKMTIKVPITGNKIKIWIVVVSTLLLAVIGGCIYMLIKNKKVTK